jgi:hypothetical protein
MPLTEHERAVLASLERDLARTGGLRHAPGLLLLALLALAAGCGLVVVGSPHLFWLSALGAVLAATSPFLLALGLSTG